MEVEWTFVNVTFEARLANPAWGLLALNTDSEEQQICFKLNIIVREQMDLLLSQFERTREPLFKVPLFFEVTSAASSESIDEVICADSQAED